MSRAASPFAGRLYGVVRVTREWEMARSSFYYQLRIAAQPQRVLRRRGQVTVFVAVDHCTTECVGLHAAKKATRFVALEPLRQGVRDYCGGFRAGAAAGIRNRHDHGSQYLSDDYQAEIAFLGMQSSPSFVRQPEWNGCVERFIHTLKEQFLWVRTFQDVQELRPGLAEVRESYYPRSIVQRLGYLTPAHGSPELLSLGVALRAHKVSC